MNIEEKRKELNTIIDNIKEHSDRLTGFKNIPTLELSAIISKSQKLLEGFVILKYMIENEKPSLDLQEEEEDADVVMPVVETPIEIEEEEVIPMEEEVEAVQEEMEEIVEEEVQEEAEEVIEIENEVETEEGVIEQLISETEEVEEEEGSEEPMNEEEENVEEVEEETPTFSFEDVESHEDMSSKQDINEVFSEKDDDSLSEQLKKQPIGDLLSAIALNERYLYANELFDGDIEDFRRVMGVLNDFDNREEASNFFEGELRNNYGWEQDNEFATALAQLVERRFQN